MVGMEEGAIADERVRLGIVGREADGSEVELPPQDVVDIVSGQRLRAPERKRLEQARLGTAAGADQPAGRCGHRASRTPVRALNSSISASQSWTIPWMSFQKDGLLRASNSSSEMPCCSTQV